MPPDSSCILTIRVQPRSSKNAVQAQPDGVLKVWTTAPPVDGEANEAVIALLAKKLHLAPSRISVVSGQTGRNKRVEVEGMSLEEATRLLQAP